MRATVFLGAGRITGALLAGLRLAGWRPETSRRPIIVHDHHSRNLRRLKKLYGVATEPDLRRAVEQARMLVVAVCSASIAALLQEIGAVDHPVIAVSLAAGVPLANLRMHLGPRARWARAMPSPLSRVGQGLTALAFDRRFPPRATREVRNLFANVGRVLEIPESQFDAFTVTFSSSHGYHAVATLADAAQKVGLDPKTALAAAAHALGDSVVTWQQGNIPLKALLHEAATPGGTAAAVMDSMDKAGFGKLIRKGLAAGIARARSNARRS